MENDPETGCKKCSHKMCVAKVPIFSDLTQEELEKISSLIIRKRYQKGEIIIHEDSCSERLIIINRGKAKAFRISAEGREQILYIFSEGDFFGERDLFRNSRAVYNVEAIEESDTCALNRNEFQKLLIDHPIIGAKIIEELSRRMELLENAMQGMGARSMDLRINSMLVQFAQKYGKRSDKGILVDLPLSREGIASYIGTTRETVSRKLGSLSEEGTIKLIGNRKILIYDMEALTKNV
jgi:CRP/FNR family transcriptional regulator, anaerobic regulatory protein